MSDLAPRPSRATREQRAFRLVTVGGVAAVVGVVGLVLAIAGVVGGWIPVIAFVIAAVCIYMFRGMTRRG
jgi:CHASE2 domain-containing sensor protein